MIEHIGNSKPHPVKLKRKLQIGQVACKILDIMTDNTTSTWRLITGECFQDESRRILAVNDFTHGLKKYIRRLARPALEAVLRCKCSLLLDLSDYINSDHSSANPSQNKSLDSQSITYILYGSSHSKASPSLETVRPSDLGSLSQHLR